MTRLALALCCGASIASASTFTVRTAAELIAQTPRMRAGDTLLLEPGTYSLSSWNVTRLVGAPQAPITFRGAAAGVVILGNAYANVINVTDCHWLRFEDLEITSSGQYPDIDGVKFGTGTRSSNVVFDRCRIHGLAGNGISAQADLVDRLTVTASEIADVGVCGLYLGYPSPLRQVTNTVIRNCWIHDCANGSNEGYGIQIKGGSWGALIENNVLHDVGGTTRAGVAVYYADPAGGQPPERWNVIRGNVLWNVRNEAIYAVNSAVIENNVVFDAVTGISITSYGGNVVDQLLIRNNTIYRCARYGLWFGDADRARASVLIANNAALMESPTVAAYRAAIGLGPATALDNAAYGTSNFAAGVFAVGAPATQFVRAGAGIGPGTIDLGPSASSALRNRALPGTAPQTDADGGWRDARPDTGAYEAGAAVRWIANAGFKPAVDPLTPLWQEVPRGGTAQLVLRHGAPAGTRYALLMSLAGPWPGGWVPVIPDGATLLSLQPLPGVLDGYVGTLAGPGERVMRLTFPVPPGLPPLVLYHAAILADPVSGRVVGITNCVRVVLRP
jgi:hypothetical protein